MRFRVDGIGRKFCRKHGRATCRRCGCDFSQRNSMAQARASTSRAQTRANDPVFTVQDVAEQFSSLSQVMLLMGTAQSPPLQDFQTVISLLDDTVHVLQILHSEGANVEGPLRHALSWMKPALLEEILGDLGICQTFQWQPSFDSVLSGASYAMQELKIPENWQKLYYFV